MKKRKSMNTNEKTRRIEKKERNEEKNSHRRLSGSEFVFQSGRTRSDVPPTPREEVLTWALITGEAQHKVLYEFTGPKGVGRGALASGTFRSSSFSFFLFSSPFSLSWLDWGWRDCFPSSSSAPAVLVAVLWLFLPVSFPCEGWCVLSWFFSAFASTCFACFCLLSFGGGGIGGDGALSFPYSVSAFCAFGWVSVSTSPPCALLDLYLPVHVCLSVSPSVISASIFYLHICVFLFSIKIVTGCRYGAEKRQF